MLHAAISKGLKNFSVDVEFKVGNEIIVLFGPSGAGKTTILNCIAGLTQPDTGMIKLNDRLLFENKKKQVAIQKRHIGYLFQDFALFPHMTVEKNVRYGLKDEGLLSDLINIVGIKHILDSYPKNISGGEKQRVALVRALATKPELLLLDEPLSSLDQKTREQCQDELLRLHMKWNIPVIMVTHDYSEAEKLGDQILLLEKGKIVRS